MKFDHKVKFNGVYYETGADVPVSNSVEEKTETKVVESIKVETPSVTKEEIESMNNIMKLRKLAKENGISFDGLNVAELKDAIIKGLNL